MLSPIITGIIFFEWRNVTTSLIPYVISDKVLPFLRLPKSIILILKGTYKEYRYCLTKSGVESFFCLPTEESIPIIAIFIFPSCSRSCSPLLITTLLQNRDFSTYSLKFSDLVSIGSKKILQLHFSGYFFFFFSKPSLIITIHSSYVTVSQLDFAGILILLVLYLMYAPYLPFRIFKSLSSGNSLNAAAAF